MSHGWLDGDLDVPACCPGAHSHPYIHTRRRSLGRSRMVVPSPNPRRTHAVTDAVTGVRLPLTEAAYPESDGRTDDVRQSEYWTSVPELDRLMGRRGRRSRSSRASRPHDYSSDNQGRDTAARDEDGKLAARLSRPSSFLESLGPLGLQSPLERQQLVRDRAGVGRWRLTDVYKRIDDLASAEPRSTGSARPNSWWTTTSMDQGRRQGGRAREDVLGQRLPQLNPPRSPPPAWAISSAPVDSPSRDSTRPQAQPHALQRSSSSSSTPIFNFSADSSLPLHRTTFTGVTLSPDEQRRRDYLFLPDCPETTSSPSNSSLLANLSPPDSLPYSRIESRRPDLLAELRSEERRSDWVHLDDTLGRRAPRERLLRRHLLGLRMERNRSLQDMAHHQEPRIIDAEDPGARSAVNAASSSSVTPASVSSITTSAEEREIEPQDSDVRRVALQDIHGTGVGDISQDSSANNDRIVGETEAGGGGEDDKDDQDLQEAILPLLECPVCRDFLQPPLKQCCNGHVVCFACWPRLSLSLCPACRAPFIPTASLALDGVLRTIRFPCPNKEHGCTLRLRMDDRAAHDQVCPFRPRGCPMTRCEWQGLSEALVPHCRSAHPPIPVPPDALSVTVSFLVDRGAAVLDGVPTIVYHEQRLLSLDLGSTPGDSAVFLFQSRYDLWRSKFFADMVRVASQLQPHEQYSWEVELSSPDGTAQLRMRSPVSSEAAAHPSTSPRDSVVPASLTPGSLRPGTSSLPPSSPTPVHPTSTTVGLKLDLDMFNQFMEAGRYTLRITLHPAKTPS